MTARLWTKTKLLRNNGITKLTKPTKLFWTRKVANWLLFPKPTSRLCNGTWLGDVADQGFESFDGFVTKRKEA